MRPTARFIMAGVVAAALGAPAYAQTPSTDPSGSSTQGATSTGTQGTQQPSSTSPTSTTSSAATSAGVDEAAAREHLSQARQALAELTKLPAAAQLQGEQRTSISNLIQAFNALATATTDWRPKFKAVSEQVDQILASDTGAAAGATAGTSGTTSTDTTASPGSTAGSASSSGTSAASAGGYDPAIIAKVREVRTHLDGFQESSGDPTPHFDAIDKIVDAALSGGGAESAVGTSGATASPAGTTGAAAGGSVTISRAQLEEIKQHVAKLRAASEAAARRQ